MSRFHASDLSAVAATKPGTEQVAADVSAFSTNAPEKSALGTRQAFRIRRIKPLDAVFRDRGASSG